MSKIKKDRAELSGREVEELVGELLRAAGVTGLAESRVAGRGADFAFWSQSLSATLGNPILVEVKAGNLDTHRIAAAHEQLAKFVSEAGARAGLLIYFDRRGREFPVRKWAPLVVAFDLEDLARQLTHKPFSAARLFAVRVRREECGRGGNTPR